jgi:hypothetical protein
VSSWPDLQLGKLFGDGAGVWVRMQAAYDTWTAERKEEVSKSPTLCAKGAYHGSHGDFFDLHDYLESHDFFFCALYD